ncbi:hypothetical protein ABL78_6567 [Leptomonas seymouri]|uniref:Uncharacterized protein n=1 Tax=Leptomonas seymouri TaxID=5684 RepID=A0A0N0P3Q0_LEPSE|nr:hypothetical protein ABL78_6567 [Leptomonas seymouri]|eukprot:KPI84386.1 hypothetical protein ABL78_6567 [Leptomonas seymouri]
MLTQSQLLLRRRGRGHVVKYLEGVPTPSKLIDHLAGADLHASAELPFFSTVPRYVDSQREHRLSKLFFHHVLYPAGGARMPYQAVVVRGGRAVRSSAPRLWHKTNPIAKGEKEHEGKKENQRSPLPSAADPSKPPQCRSNPLAVPASQLGSSASFATLSTQPSSSSKMTVAVTATALVEDIPSPASWVRVDPARRPYFFTRASTNAGKPQRYRNTHADSGPAVTNRYLPSSRKGAHDTVPAARDVEDSVLAPLRGVLEHFWNNKVDDAAQAQSPVAAARLQQLLVSPFAGLLWMSEQGSSGGDHASSTSAISKSNHSPSSIWERLIGSVQCSAIASAGATLSIAARSTSTDSGSLQQQSIRRTLDTFVYVQTRLPPAAVVALPAAPNGSFPELRGGLHGKSSSAGSAPLREGNECGDSFLCRMAGGVEPVVPFAVGQPLKASSAASTSPSEDFFSHISCLTRVSLRVSLSEPSPPPAPRVTASAETMLSSTRGYSGLRSDRDDSNAKVRLPQSAAEPWKLGDDGLDLMVPHHVRTVVERHPTKSLQQDAQHFSATTSGAPQSAAQSGRYVLGRADAETYLLPQRELLLTLYVPKRTEDMCAAQNDDRLQRLVRAGRASRSAMMTWSTDHTRQTSSRCALGQYTNAESATKTGTFRQPASPSTSPSKSPQRSREASPAELLAYTSFEVRALPGDAVYIPRGWGYDVQRILGTATMHNGHSKAVIGGEATYGFRDHRALGGKSNSSVSTHSARSLEATSPLPQHREDVEAGEGASVVASTEISSMEIDAFCLSYRPYPELTAAQAAVYVAANYVHTGVDDFYEQGGNQVYRLYE